MDQYLVRPIDFRISEVADICFQPHLRRPDSQNGGRNGQERRRGGETRVQIVWKGGRSSHLEPAIPVRQGASVTCSQNLVLDFRLQIMQFCFDRGALLVVIDLAVREKHMFDAEVKNVDGLTFFLGFWLRNVAAAILIADQVNHGMLNHDLVEVNLAMQRGDDLEINRELIESEQRPIGVFLGAVQDEAVNVSTQVTPVEIKILDLRPASCGLVGSFHNLREDVTMKTAAPQN